MKGITLIELMVTLSVIAIIIAVGVPRLQTSTQGSRLTTAINSLSADFALARSEAVTRKMTVRVSSASGNTDWSQGWVVEAVPTAGPVVLLRSGTALVGNILLTGDAATLTYNSDGTQTAAVELNFKTCKNGDLTPHGKEVRVSVSGRIKLAKDQGCP